MDALIKAAQEKVVLSIAKIDDSYFQLSTRKILIARAINAVDALKSALKTIQ